MPVPNAKEIRKPLLEVVGNGFVRSLAMNDFLELVADAFGKNINEMSSAEKNMFKNNINQAKIYLESKKLLSNPSKNTYMITEKGSKLLEDNPDYIDDDYFDKTEIEIIPENPPDPEPEVEAKAKNIEEVGEVKEVEEQMVLNFTENDLENEFNNAVEEIVEPEEIVADSESEIETESDDILDVPAEEISEDDTQKSEDVEEVEEVEEEIAEPEQHSSGNIEDVDINDVIAKYNSELMSEVLSRVADLPSDKFEVLVIDLLSKMGFFAFQTARYKNDAIGSDLIQGVIIDSKNPGSKPIYIQARRSSPSKIIGKTDMNAFIAALKEKGGSGMFATTARFSDQAKMLAADEEIMLMDGQTLADQMIKNNLCVNVVQVVEIKSLDLDALSEYDD